MAILPLLFALRWPDRVLGVILHAPGVAQQNGKGSPGDNADPALTKDVHDFWDTIALAKFSALRTIELPLLITMSRDHGPDMPEMSETLGRAVPKSSTVVLPASGRALTMVQKQEFIDAAVTFSRRVLGSRGE